MNISKIIAFKNVTKSYNSVTAVKDVSFIIEEGESVALVGANGAGKTTLFNILLGLINPDFGESFLLNSHSLNISTDILSQINFIADHASPIPWASSNDIASLYRSIYPQWNNNKYTKLMDLFNIDENRRLNRLSKGQKRLAEISLALATTPKILILDEPFNGLDALMRIQVQKILKKTQVETGLSILYSTHIISELHSIADRMIILLKGQIIFDQKLTDNNITPEKIFHHHHSEYLKCF